MTPTIRNAVIAAADVGMDDAPLTLLLRFDYGGSGQALPGYRLDGPGLGPLVASLLATLEVGRLSECAGVACRVEHTESEILAVGHILHDRWWRPANILRDVRADWLSRVEWSRREFVPVLVPRKVAGLLKDGGGTVRLTRVDDASREWLVATGHVVKDVEPMAADALREFLSISPGQSPDRLTAVTAHEARKLVRKECERVATLARFRVGLLVDRLERDGHGEATTLARDAYRQMERWEQEARAWPRYTEPLRGATSTTAADAAGA